jgi:hypothetical protein
MRSSLDEQCRAIEEVAKRHTDNQFIQDAAMTLAMLKKVEYALYQRQPEQKDVEDALEAIFIDD